jgi:pantetheine-phosphate adenylyltransferase
MKKAIFPGSFDPMHKGHISIIEKASDLFDYVYVAITDNPEKANSKTLKKRHKAALLNFPNRKNIELIINPGELTASLATKLNCKYLIRSGRDDIDFKYELELAAANNSLNSQLETILIIPNYKNIDYKSRLIKQIKTFQ